MKGLNQELIYDSSKNCLLKKIKKYEKDKEKIKVLIEKGMPEAIELGYLAPKIFIDNEKEEEYKKKYGKIIELYGDKPLMTNNSAELSGEGKNPNIMNRERQIKKILACSEDELEKEVFPFCTYSLLKEFKVFIVGKKSIGVSQEKKDLFNKAYKKAENQNKGLSKKFEEQNNIMDNKNEDKKRSLSKKTNHTKSVIIEDIITDECAKEGSIETLIAKKNQGNFYTKDFINIFWTNEKSITWLSKYCQVLINNPSKENRDAILHFAEKSFSNIGKDDLKKLLNLITPQDAIYVFEGLTSDECKEDFINKIIEFSSNNDEMLESFTKFFYDSNNIHSAIHFAKETQVNDNYKRLFILKFEEQINAMSGSIDNELLEELIKGIGILYAEDSNIWLRNYGFWKNIKSNLFMPVCEEISEHYDFYQIAYDNILICKIHKDNQMISKWMEVFVKVGLTSNDDGESFNRYYKEIQREGKLSDREIAQLNSLIFNEAISYKKSFDVEKEKSNRKIEEVYSNIANTIIEALTDIEQFIANDFHKTMNIDEYRDTLKDYMHKLRNNMRNCNLYPIINPDDWKEQKRMDYNISDFKKDDCICVGETVIPISMGIKVNNGSHIVKAIAKK